MFDTPGSRHKELYCPQSSATIFERWFKAPSLNRPNTKEEVPAWIDSRESLFSPTLRGLIAHMAEMQSYVSGNSITFEGVENIPTQGPVILGINHPSKLSPVRIGAVALKARKDMIAIGKMELESGETGKPSSYLQRKFMSEIAIPIMRPVEDTKLIDAGTLHGIQELISRSRSVLIAVEGGTDRYSQNYGVLEDGLRIIAARTKSKTGEVVQVVPTNIDSHNHITFYPRIFGSEFRQGYPQRFVDQVFPNTQYPTFGSQSWNLIQQMDAHLHQNSNKILVGSVLNNLVEQVHGVGDQSLVDAREQIKKLTELSNSNPKRVQFLWDKLDEYHK